MSLLEFITAHPWWGLTFLVVGLRGCGKVAAAPVHAWRKHDRADACPRCNGTGRDGQ